MELRQGLIAETDTGTYIETIRLSTTGTARGHGRVTVSVVPVLLTRNISVPTLFLHTLEITIIRKGNRHIKSMVLGII